MGKDNENVAWLDWMLEYDDVYLDLIYLAEDTEWYQQATILNNGKGLPLTLEFLE